MKNFRDYIEFKEQNPYAEKDENFERVNTPYLNKKG